MKNIKDIVIGFIVLALAAVFYKVVIGIVIVFLVLCLFLTVNDYIDTIKLNRFRKRNEGRYFLFYSSNKRLKPAIENALKPLLNFEYEIIYNNRNNMKTDLTPEQLRHLQDRSYLHKLPLLYKIGKNEVSFISLQTEVYELKEQIISKEIFEKKVKEKLNKLNTLHRINNE